MENSRYFIDKIYSQKHFKILLGVLLFAAYTNAQTFSIRYHEESVTVLSNVWILNYGFLVAGTMPDLIDGLHSDALISKVSNGGEVLYTKKYGTAEFEFRSVNDNNTFVQGDSLYVSAYQRFHSDTAKCVIVWYLNNGDTLKTKSFKSPMWYGLGALEGNWFQPKAIDLAGDGGLYLTCQTTNEVTGNDFIILKTDPDGNLLWYYYFGVDIEDVWQDIDLCYTLGAVDDGVIVAGATQVLENGNWAIERFLKLDVEGNLVWQKDDISEFNASHPEEMVVDTDGFVCVNTLDDMENPVNGSNGLIYKLDFDGNLMWYNGELELDYYVGFTCLTKSCDGGYVCTGRNWEPLEPPDSLSYDNNTNLIIAKYDSIGTLLWHRKYLYVNSPYDYHEMYDLKATHDGGYIMVGEATDNWQDNPNLELPRQQAWILKVDGCGCLVPGCDEFCTPPDCSPPNVVDVPKPDYFLYGPNPVENSFYIYFDGTDMELGDLEFHLYDISGRLVDGFVPTESDMTYLGDGEVCGG
jgi:hypothetical protein